MQHQIHLTPVTDNKAKVKPAKLTPISVGSPVGLELHPLALVFPAYAKDDLDTLTDDIRLHGMRQPVVLFEDLVLDGRNRVVAAARIAAERTNFYIPRVMFEGTFEQARDYVISLNLLRRHLTDDQRTAIAARLADMPQGGDRSKPPTGGLVTVAEAAENMKVPKRTVERAKAVGKPDLTLLDEVAEGKTKLSTAVKKAAFLKTLPKQTPTTTKKEINRHDERMKSARYKLEAFVRDYTDMNEWKLLIEAIKRHPEMAPGKLGAALKAE